MVNLHLTLEHAHTNGDLMNRIEKFVGKKSHEYIHGHLFFV